MSQMSRMNAPTPDAPNRVGIAQQQYDAFTAEITAMPERKRKQWKAHLFDKFGARTCCKFENNQILNWSVAAQAWLEVVVLDRPREDEATSRLGRMLAAGIPHNVAFPIEVALNTAKAPVDDY